MKGMLWPSQCATYTREHVAVSESLGGGSVSWESIVRLGLYFFVFSKYLGRTSLRLYPVSSFLGYWSLNPGVLYHGATFSTFLFRA